MFLSGWMTKIHWFTSVLPLEHFQLCDDNRELIVDENIEINMADYARFSVVGIFTLFAVLTVKDLFISPTQSTSSNTKEIPVTRVGVDKFIGPTLKVLYWWAHPVVSLCRTSLKLICMFFCQLTTILVFCSYSCGYRKAFEQYANILQEKYPEIIVTGDNYQPSSTRTYVAQAIVSLFCTFSMLDWTLIFYQLQGPAQDGCSHVHCSWNQPILKPGIPKNPLLVAMVCQQQDLRLHDDIFHGQCPRRSTGLNWRVWNVLQW